MIRSASGLCDRLVVAIGVHPGKAPLFSAQERAEMIELVCAKPAVC
jgi:pantetheine-phosphate adenylyltransferase